MNHPQRFLIVAFCDSTGKRPGKGDITYFRPEHQFVAEHIPSQAELKAYALGLGYRIGVKPRSDPNRCEPVYSQIGIGLDYVNCKTCFPIRPVIDNRNAPAA